MNKTELARLQELRAKEQLDEKEFAQWQFLEKKVVTDERVKQFRKNQQEPYSSKRSRAANLAWEFYNQLSGQCYVAVGGLDSIVLYLFLRSIGIKVPAVSVTSLEDKSIQKIHKALGVLELKPLKSKVKVIREFGWPVISKEVAGKIATIQHPTERNATVRHAIITGETGAQGGYRTGTKMQMKQRWLKLFGGADLEGQELGYQEADFLVSDKCCYYLKEMPCEIYHKDSGRWPYMGLMASEGGRREKALAVNGCNYISETTKRSCPFATFYRQDILTLALEMEVWYQMHWREFHPRVWNRDAEQYVDGDPVHLDSIVPAIYGSIERNEKGELYTTDAQRTGCSMCGFGIHMEDRPHRFDLLWERNPKEWEMWMNHVVMQEDGTWYGWGRVLDYIGVKWKNPEVHIKAKRDAEAVEQLMLEGI